MIDFSNPFVAQYILTLKLTAASILGAVVAVRAQCFIKKNHIYNIIGFIAFVGLAAHFRTQLGTNPQPYIIMMVIGAAIQCGIYVINNCINNSCKTK